jgi:Fur family peroxide stress response transcriptional regulator
MGHADNNGRLETLVASLRGNGHRITPQRMAMLKVLAESKDHLSAEEIFEKIRSDYPTTSLATVYKTISVLKDLGELMELDFGDDRKRFDGRHTEPHPHFVCRDCSKIFDVDLDSLEMLQKEAAEKTGFEVDDHRVTFFGRCSECRKKQ